MIGTLVSRYRILSRIGAGGMGEVFLAHDPALADAVGILEAARVGSSDDVQIIDALAAAQAGAGNLDAAVATYKEVTAARALGFEAQEYWLQAHLRLGEVYERLGRPADAREQYARLVSLWKDGDADLPALREAKARLSKVK
jgi:tetratricopeptide (TPR) repeat protein